MKEKASIKQGSEVTVDKKERNNKKEGGSEGGEDVGHQRRAERRAERSSLKEHGDRGSERR